MKKILLILVAVLSILTLTSCSDGGCSNCGYHGATPCIICQDHLSLETSEWGKGVIRCEICEGTGLVGELDCLLCGARGYYLCLVCNGRGAIDCPFCYAIY